MSQDYTLGQLPYLVEVDETQRTWTLERTIRYRLVHLAHEADGVAGTGTGTGNTSDIILDLSAGTGTIDADYTPQEGKIILQSGKDVVLPANVTSLRAVSVSGSVAVQVIPHWV
jgi:hypothetical protein